MSQPLILQHVSAFGCNIRPFSVLLFVHLMGCCAEICLVATGEIRSIGEAHQGSDLCHTALAFGQKLACSIEARVAQQFHGTWSGERLALAEQLGTAQADVGGQKLDGIVLVAEVLLDQLAKLCEEFLVVFRQADRCWRSRLFPLVTSGRRLPSVASGRRIPLVVSRHSGRLDGGLFPLVTSKRRFGCFGFLGR